MISTNVAAKLRNLATLKKYGDGRLQFLKIVLVMGFLVNFVKQEAKAGECHLVLFPELEVNLKVALQGIPFGRRSTEHPQDWGDHLAAASHELTSALNLIHQEWHIPGDETGLISIPNALLGEVVVGIVQNVVRTNSQSWTFLTEIFGGKVTKVSAGDIQSEHTIVITLATKTGTQEINILGARHVRVLRTQQPLVKMDIPAVDSLPLGKEKAFVHTAFSALEKRSKAHLLAALNAGEWRSAGNETIYGTNVASPMDLQGKIICGVSVAYGPVPSVTILAGRVTEISRVWSETDFPAYHGKIEGPLGVHDIIIPDLKLLHILNESPTP